VTKGGGKELEEPLVVRPTSETIINHMFAQVGGGGFRGVGCWGVAVAGCWFCFAGASEHSLTLILDLPYPQKLSQATQPSPSHPTQSHSPPPSPLIHHHHLSVGAVLP